MSEKRWAETSKRSLNEGKIDEGKKESKVGKKKRVYLFNYHLGLGLGSACTYEQVIPFHDFRPF